jgi:hypothetical protein
VTFLGLEIGKENATHNKVKTNLVPANYGEPAETTLRSETNTF